MLRFFNTLTNQLEEFQPLEDGKVRLYVCGPTVWSYAHIGNFRTFTFEDVLRRYLKYKGFELTHVMNLTDVDDRIINEAKAAGKTIDEFVQPFIEAFWDDFDALGLERPEVAPRATKHVAEMIEIIAKLLENGRAYESGGSIYYRISAFPNYGKLSKINFAGNIAGASGRVDTDKYDKENANDFALWKLVGEDETPGWEAPFGRGRPGWHIECSAMSMKYLGETFDIHAGGVDLKFPHHENEIAQSEGATGKLFAKYWLHAEHLKVEGETMSKSLGNYYTFRDLVDKGYSAKAVRYTYLSVPYHKQFNFTFETLNGAEKTVEKLKDFRNRIENWKTTDEGKISILQNDIQKTLRDFEDGMDDNLNTAVALAVIHNFVRDINISMSTRGMFLKDKILVLEAIRQIDQIFGIFGEEENEVLDAEIKKLIEDRQEARRNRNFAESDDIRDFLISDGVIIEDTKEGARWKKVKEILEDEKRIRNIMAHFSDQKVSGDLFGVIGEVTLPKFTQVLSETRIKPDLRIDAKGVSENEVWWVEVKSIGKSQKPSRRIVEQMKKYHEILRADKRTRSKIWLAVFGELPENFRKELSALGIYYSTRSDIEEIAKLLRRGK